MFAGGIAKVTIINPQPFSDYIFAVMDLTSERIIPLQIHCQNVKFFTYETLKITYHNKDFRMAIQNFKEHHSILFWDETGKVSLPRSQS